MAKGCGFNNVNLIRSKGQLIGLRRAIHQGAGPVFAQVKVVAEKIPLVLPPRDGGLLKARFRRALLGEQADLD